MGVDVAEKKRKRPTVSKLKKKLDKIFSIYIRKRDKGICFTCFKADDWKYMQAGHYISRNHNSLRYDERNVHCQCRGCNIFKHGNMDVYALRLQQEYGNNIFIEFNQRKNFLKSFTCDDLESLIKYYIKKIKKEGITYPLETHQNANLPLKTP